MGLFKSTITRVTGRGYHLFADVGAKLLNTEGLFNVMEDGSGTDFHYRMNLQDGREGVVRIESATSMAAIIIYEDQSYTNNFLEVDVYPEQDASAPTETVRFNSSNIILGYAFAGGSVVYLKEGTRTQRYLVAQSIDTIILRAHGSPVTTTTSTTSTSTLAATTTATDFRVTNAAVIAYNKIRLTTSEQALPLSLELSEFFVYTTGLGFNISQFTVGANYIDLDGGSISPGETVTITYTGPSAESTLGNPLALFTNLPATNNITTTTTTTVLGFQVVSAEAIAYNKIRLTTSETALPISLELAEWSVASDGAGFNISQFTVGANYIDLDGTVVGVGDTLTVTYTGPTAESTGGTPLDTFTNLPVVNSVTTTTTTTTESDFRVVSGAATFGNIRLATTETALSLSLETAEWAVTQDGTPMTIAQFTVGTNYIDLSVADLFGGTTILVSYTGSSAESMLGNPLDNFTNLAIVNNILDVPYVLWDYGTSYFRMTVRSEYLALDQRLSETGFDGTEAGLDWVNLWTKRLAASTTSTTTTSSTTSTTTIADFRVTSGEAIAYNKIRLQTTELALPLTLELAEWSVTTNGVGFNISSFTVGSTYIDLDGSSILPGETVSVTYVGPTAQSSLGNPLETFTDLSITNSVTTTTTTTSTTTPGPFHVTSAVANVYNKIRLYTTEQPLSLSLELTEFSVTSDGTGFNISGFTVGANYIELDGSSVVSGDTLTVTYVGPTAESTLGTPLDLFTDFPVTNNV
jgi:hypothetical protein